VHWLRFLLRLFHVVMAAIDLLHAIRAKLDASTFALKLRFSSLVQAADAPVRPAKASSSPLLCLVLVALYPLPAHIRQSLSFSP
jgi:hypothetical protein